MEISKHIALADGTDLHHEEKSAEAAANQNDHGPSLEHELPAEHVNEDRPPVGSSSLACEVLGDNLAQIVTPSS